MKYALKLAEDGRIISATYKEHAVHGMILVDNLPDGDIAQYRYEDGGYVYDPLPKPETAPTLNERMTDMEEAFALLISGVTE